MLLAKTVKLEDTVCGTTSTFNDLEGKFTILIEDGVGRTPIMNLATCSTSMGQM